MKDILLLTANVGSLFDHLSNSQTMDGKCDRGDSQRKLPVRRSTHAGELSDYTAALAILDLDFDQNDQYTALGSMFLVHKSALHTVKQYNFHEEKYQLLRNELTIVRKNLSECPVLVKTKFPKHFWPAIKWGRKGYMHTRWKFNGTPVDLINVHLFHDESNLALIHENPSLYSNNRKRALNYVLDQLQSFSNGERHANAVFIFGDLNFRLDTPSFLNRLTGNGQADAHHHLEDPHGSISGNQLIDTGFPVGNSGDIWEDGSANDPLRRTVSAIEFRTTGDSIASGDVTQNCVLRIEKKLFDYFNHKKLLKDWQGYLADDREVHDFPSLKELNINFPPTEDPDESEVLMKTRAPAWCDRVLMNDQAHRLVSQDKGVSYDSVGKDTCMGDHKPVFLSFSVSSPTISRIH
uniref:inositol-polyphosphate 5-phosphatase n=1 Tax=Steinernema glaseri TaxID=37863 RepID=A0A1I7YB54_9BILA